jgi:hypothetical protein
MGERKQHDFTSNMFLDVYNGDIVLDFSRTQPEFGAGRAGR